MSIRGPHQGREVQAESGLSTADYGILVHLAEVPEGRLRVLELAKAVEWETSRMSHHINRMATRGPAVREDCPTDARVAFVAVTPTGREARAMTAPRHVEAVRRLFIDPLTPAALAMLAQTSDHIIERLQKDYP
ncbi:MarR family winged helix-turn-helix transcriptional regulator [Streptomyces sp. V4I2]|uniref:MarR family winged helix-turn-helix transcriptional regulator n=1 Tax=Streptomyces sp. V4I2 TaxID=3042280 RepID=UPI002783FF56|nr:MarR family winged helix-turn-helix transcriptional regulator [Streptomyces sp. V4I2]MDQ1042606.1 DNA-binding MarR family transcriptional regulator [Streptomyces sp. V4I2]